MPLSKKDISELFRDLRIVEVSERDYEDDSEMTYLLSLENTSHPDVIAIKMEVGKAVLDEYDMQGNEMPKEYLEADENEEADNEE